MVEFNLAGEKFHNSRRRWCKHALLRERDRLGRELIAVGKAGSQGGGCTFAREVGGGRAR